MSKTKRYWNDNILLGAFPFSWKQLSLWTFGITLQAHAVFGKIHEVTPDNNIQHPQQFVEIKTSPKKKKNFD